MQDVARPVRHISVDPKPRGTVAVYLVEVHTEEQSRTLGKLFEELKPHISIVQLSRGRLVSYAVKAGESDCLVLDELEKALRSNFEFVVMQRSFDRVIHRVVKDLCADTGSRLLPIPRCNICGDWDPFPETIVTLADENGDPVVSRSYCGTCTASFIARTNKAFVLSLLSADRRDFGPIERSELIRSGGRSRHLRYRVRR